MQKTFLFYVSETLAMYVDLCLCTQRVACVCKPWVFFGFYFPKIYFCTLKVIFSILTPLKSI